MLRRFGLPLVLAAAGFLAGIVVTGRGRAAEMFRANETPRALETGSDQRPAPVPAAAPATQAFSTGGPDFTRVAGQAVKGVANISSLQVVRRSNWPFADDPLFR